MEWCLCDAAGGGGISPRSVQQVGECTDGRKLDQGTSVERGNIFCEVGFPDVHMDFIIRSVSGLTTEILMIDNGSGLNGSLESAQLKPESKVNSGCDTFVADPPRARVTEYVSDFFTTEDHLMRSVGTIGPTATNIVITPEFQFYEGGIFYNEEECVNYALEDVPLECEESRAGILSYTCLSQNGTVCSQLMPAHCDPFFIKRENRIPHTVTVFGYGEDEDGRQFWKIKNSWGPDWGEGGYMRLARGLGHCNVGSLFAVPRCQ